MAAAAHSRPEQYRRGSHATPVAGIKWGADLKKLGICVAIGAALWVSPAPAGVSSQAWHLLAVFLSTICGIITTPMPLGAVAMMGLAAAQLTGVLTFAQAFSAFASEVGTRQHGALLYAIPSLTHLLLPLNNRSRG